jgi:hypothetical protein
MKLKWRWRWSRNSWVVTSCGLRKISDSIYKVPWNIFCCIKWERTIQTAVRPAISKWSSIRRKQEVPFWLRVQWSYPWICGSKMIKFRSNTNIFFVSHRSVDKKYLWSNRLQESMFSKVAKDSSFWN